jgi:hypothetical protein
VSEADILGGEKLGFVQDVIQGRDGVEGALVRRAAALREETAGSSR